MMNKTVNNNYPSVKFIVLLSFMISVLVQVGMFLSFYFGYGTASAHEKMGRPQFHLDGFIINIMFTFILALLLFLYCMFVQKKNISDMKKLINIILGLMLNTVVLSCIFTTLHPMILGLVSDDMPPMRRDIHFFFYHKGLIRDFFVTIVVAFSWELIVLNNKRQKVVLENERLIAENHIARYEALKNQINPHFLFNSLNTLQSLIRVEQVKAENYVQELSKVLRYTLQNDETVTLEEEVQLANSFCTLMQLRYGSNLKFNFDVDERLLHDEIIPLSLQILIENAIKHNVISDKQPLTVDIISDFENRKLVVKNKMQPKIDKNTGNGIGLANLSERYRLKWNSDIEISNDGDVFSVVLKLNNVK